MLKRMMTDCKKYIDEGAVADYIPELSKADKNWFALGYMEGDTLNLEGDRKDFTLQSITKVFSLIQALALHGEEKVFQHVGYQGTHEPYNTLDEIVEGKVPTNPMINSGAITITSLLGAHSAKKLVDQFKVWTGYDHFYIDEAVATSEEKTGLNNYAIGYLLEKNGTLEMTAESALHEYFTQCAIATDIEGLVRLGHWLATSLDTWGTEKITGERLCEIITGILISGGMYDASSKFFIDTGVPAKSGVGGGIVAFTPGVRGYGVFGPALDEFGNSIAGVCALRKMVHELNGRLI